MENPTKETKAARSEPLNADGSEPKLLPHKTALQDPANHGLAEIFEELKFGRPAASQIYLQKCIDELNKDVTLAGTAN